jgi:arylsulfatase A-like enzyme
VVEAPVDRNLLTKRYTDEAIRYLTQNRDRPFFLFLSHAMPGSTPAPFASAAFRGRSANGPWGDSVEEIDWSTGQLMAAIKELGLDDRTLVIWTSDNGAPRRDPPQGSNRPLGGWGYSTDEGGMRMPCIARWPGRVPASKRCEELVTLMDLLPTMAALAGASLPADRPIDGRDIGPLLAGDAAAKSPHEAFYYYALDQLQAVRSGPWKLCLPLERRLGPGQRGSPQNAALYDVASDPGEINNLLADHPEVVTRLTALAGKARLDLGDLGRDGRGQRPAGRIENPQPQVPK